MYKRGGTANTVVILVGKLNYHNALDDEGRRTSSNAIHHHYPPAEQRKNVIGAVHLLLADISV